MKKKILLAVGLSVALLFAEGQTNTFPSSGNVGIGTTVPSGALDIKKDPSVSGSEIYFTGQSGAYQNSNSLRLNFVGSDQKAGFGIQAINAGSYGIKDLVFYAHNAADYTSYDEVVRFRFNGKVGIGTATPAALLDVNGTTYSRKMFIGTPDANTTNYMGSNNLLAVKGTAVFVKAKVAMYGSAWPDYVFSPQYQLPTLDSLERFIKANQRLPEMPSAREVEKDGLDLGNTQALLVKKVEELTLIMIKLEKRIKELEGNNNK